MEQSRKSRDWDHISRRDILIFALGAASGAAADFIGNKLGKSPSEAPAATSTPQRLDTATSEPKQTPSDTPKPSATFTQVDTATYAPQQLSSDTPKPSATFTQSETASLAKENSDLMLCVDTMKESRDRAQSLTKYEAILPLVQEVAKTGATHIAIGTPYDEHFGPLLHTWVKASRDSGLKVFYRGNFCESGKDADWFLGLPHDPAKTPEQHLASMKKFISNPQNKDLFQPGDVLSIPEPEESNRTFPDVYGKDKEKFIQFISDSANNMRQQLDSIGAISTKIAISHNADIANIIPDEVNTLVGSIDLDHYSEKDPTEMQARIQSFKDNHPGQKIWITETGAGRADRQGKMNSEQQANYLDLTMKAIRFQEISNVNYWGLLEGDTLLVDGPISGPYTEKAAYQVLSKHFHEMRGLA